MTGTLAVLTGITLATSPVASASTVLPDEPKKSCASTVRGGTGDTVAITGESVADVVDKGADRAKKILVLSELTIWDDHLSDVTADAGTIEVGTVPDAKRSTIPGKDIAAEVVKVLEGEPGLGFDPGKTLAIIEDTVAEQCGLTVLAGDRNPSTTSAPPQRQDRSGPNAGAAEAGAGGHSTAEATQRYDPGDTPAPRRDYGGIPAVPAPSAGLAVPPDLRYPPEASLPQEPPSFDILGGGGGDTQSGDRPRVREAGNADALAAQAGPERVQLPMLLAVVALAMVTAALVRTWVMRRTT